MNDLVRTLAADRLKEDPELAKMLEDFELSQAEFMEFLELMGLRTVSIELPPASNTEVRLRANVSGTRR